MAKLRAQLDDMERESDRLNAILELETMKQMLLKDVPAGPRSAWGEQPAATAANGNTYVNATGTTPAALMPLSAAAGPPLSADDEARLARLLASMEAGDEGDDAVEDDDEFASQSPYEMAAQLARMGAELEALKLQRDQQAQLQELEQLQAQLEVAKLAEQDARMSASTKLAALQTCVPREG